ncbi:glutathione S-transferase LANCL1-like isoform X2 [Achroia grisella]|uniref:glutathione S-transferase LANCL1-like isoform X2 n=1 Tax=Achroia grisella TaxID=688607 RepID=UPI0027D2EEB1|nr:glutathione S-transferase LANCL1-like isoform X2 [Achroia grisella]
MTSKGTFENHYDDYNKDVNNILNVSKDGLSEKFLGKLQNFKSCKLHILTTKMESDIFYDGTIYTGSAGLALYHFMCAMGKNDNSYEGLKTVLEYINIENLKGRRISFLCGDAGPLALATVISYKIGTTRPNNFPDYKTLAQRLMSLISLLNDSPDELLYGKSGYLYALLFVNKHITGKEVIPASHIEKVILAILKSGKHFSTQMKSDSPLLWQWHDKIYLGAAHGMAGILYMLLQAREYINVTELRSFIKPTIDWLLNQRFPNGNFPSSLNSSSGDRLVQWCHGAPGFVPLWLLAHQEPLHLYRACCFMEWCAVERSGTELHRPDRPASLFEGLVGRLYLAEDITHISDAKFPALCL